jgi:DUF4097 and DUF4098 domain-containing protein YvlB
MSEVIEKTFAVAVPARLNLNTIRGSVVIRAGEEGVIHVTASKEPSRGDARGTEIELAQEADATVKVATHFPEGAWSWLLGSFPCAVDYVVQVPTDCALTVNGVSSSLEAEGLKGEFSFQSVSGGIRLHSLGGQVKVNIVSGAVELVEITGSLRLNTVSGKVFGKRIRGPVHLATVSGEVVLEEASLDSIEASTVSGGMRYQTALGAGPYRFNSVSGNVVFVVPPETCCSAEIRSISGKLTTKLPATTGTSQSGNQSIEIQGGGVRVSLQSVSGNLSIVS